MNVASFLLCAAIVVTAIVADEDDDSSFSQDVLEQWSVYKLKYHKHYADPLENDKRLRIFTESLRKVDAHNRAFARGETTYTAGLNDMSDMTTKEIQAIRAGALEETA